jgi:hypothetical protein
MLDTLSKIDGFHDFKRTIIKRIESNDYSWRVEVKALYELNEINTLYAIPNNLGDKITVPEGFLKLQKIKGILECAQLDCKFDSNNDDKKEINREIYKLRQKGNSGESLLNTERGKFNIKLRPEGTIVQAHENIIDINKKIQNKYKDKRNQHKKSYSDEENFKIYYFNLVMTGNNQLVDIKKINEYLHDNEIMVLYSCFMNNNIFHEKKVLIQKKKNYIFEFKNKFFEEDMLYKFIECRFQSPVFVSFN